MVGIVFKLAENSEYFKMLIAISAFYRLSPTQMLRSMINDYYKKVRELEK